MQNSFASLARVLSVVLACGWLGAAPPTQVSAGTIVRFDTNMGMFDVELYDSVAPITVTNFLVNIADGLYFDTIVHRTVNNFVIQGGGFNENFGPIQTNPPIPLEYSLPNQRGTLAMARRGDANSANSQWFINTVDNSTSLAPRLDDPNTPLINEHSNGYAVFGRVLGDGMEVVDAIAALARYNMTIGMLNPAMGELPLINYTLADYNNRVDPTPHTVLVNSITVVPEPASLALAGFGVVAFAVAARKSRRRCH